MTEPLTPAIINLFIRQIRVIRVPFYKSVATSLICQICVAFLRLPRSAKAPVGMTGHAVKTVIGMTVIGL